MVELKRKNRSETDTVVIKKYANRRLYNTATSSYVTLDNLCGMVKENRDFVVYDAKTGEDITRSVLTQIIFEEEGKGQNLLPISFLRQLIRFYDDSLRALIPSYLEMSMESFSRNQDDIRKYMTNTLGDLFPFKQLEEMGRQNMAMVRKAVSMFTPFQKDDGTEQTVTESMAQLPTEGEPLSPTAGQTQPEIFNLKEQVKIMQQQIESLLKGKLGG